MRLLDFKEFVRATSQRLEQASLAEAEKRQRPIRYLPASSTDKEALARRLLTEFPIKEGLIRVLRVIEPCMSFEYQRSQDRSERGLKLRPRKCIHLYHYYLHPRFGFMSVRLQTWFPFNVQLCLNGREWLACQLREAGSTDFKRHENCFTALGDPELAQRLADEQLDIDWPLTLSAITYRVNPLHEQIFKPWPQRYYWSAYQTEWASDVMFRDPRTLAALSPTFTRHAMTHFQSPDVMRFLARKAPGHFTGELVTSFKDRVPGVRVKHWCNGNSIKMYEKGALLLRVETTIGNPADFKVLRPLTDRPQSKLAWRPMRKGVADLHRRAEVSQRANDTYLGALSIVEDYTPVSQLFDHVSRHTTYHHRRVRALRIGHPDDIALLKAISRGEFATAGFRNRDLRRHLHPNHRPANTAAARRLSAKVGRQIRLLRAHGLIRKISKSHRYRLTAKGHLLTAALSAARQANVKQL
ncbi:MAG: hypothetical protein WBD55_05230, partial [Dehalococcoidia bacterium]